MVRHSPRYGVAAAPVAEGRITAVLGPTNTGKTHFAMERMLAHKSGMIGFPLRLLARENYDRAVKIKGAAAVALVTGEEKIVPAGARYFLCTVEAMPMERPVEFLAVDEVQLAADPERGHVFTERLERARGRLETIFIGAETVLPILKVLVPKAELLTRPRLSRLSYAGPKKVTRLPPRSAVIGFSATEVYALAELIRRRRGGTAVVLGALSPRTRNAQVEMYQAGDVEYLVATDAIGMGLNMDIDHVAFARLTKFDGRFKRRLTPAEVGQIAGRAGRHMNDGTFGTTAGVGPLDEDLVAAVEGHDFEPLRFAYWRNPDLDFGSLDTLVASLTAPPLMRSLVPARDAEDYRTLTALISERPIRDRAASADRVKLLWDVCQVPDFRKIMGEAHVRLVGRIFTDLTGSAARVSPDWMARQVDRLDRPTGDIGALVGRIADIRTWTYVSHHSDWVDDPLHWQERTRRIEDRLSDALHERLTERFVDRRTAVLIRRLREKEDLIGAVNAAGEVLVEGMTVGHLDGFRFVPDGSVRGEDARAIRNAARKALQQALEDRLKRFESVPMRQLKLLPDGGIAWQGAVIGRLRPGGHPLTPEVEAAARDSMDASQSARIAARLRSWLETRLEPLRGSLSLDGAQTLSGPARAIVYQLGEVIGCIPRRQVADQVRALSRDDRRQLAALGVKLGAESIYFAPIYGDGQQRLAAILWSARRGGDAAVSDGRQKAPPVRDQATSMPPSYWAALGYRVAGDLAVRADRLERLDRAVRKLAKQGPVTPTADLAAAVGCDLATLPGVMAMLGFRLVGEGADGVFQRRKPASAAKRRRNRQGSGGPSPCSPFAVLRDLALPQ
ncbi:MAG: helicase-related protein [Bauldia litoralis]